MIEYREGLSKFDIASGAKKVDIFDYYWDKYRSVISMEQSNGKVNPKLWNDPKAKKKWAHHKQETGQSSTGN